MKPTEQQLRNASLALLPFVQRWGVSLNPEELNELAGAVLEHANSNSEPGEILRAVNARIDEFEAATERMRQASGKPPSRTWKLGPTNGAVGKPCQRCKRDFQVGDRVTHRGTDRHRSSLEHYQCPTSP